jgi:hypothetical protein
MSCSRFALRSSLDDAENLAVGGAGGPLDSVNLSHNMDAYSHIKESRI